MLSFKDGKIQANEYNEEAFKELDAFYERIPGTWSWKSNGRPLLQKFISLMRVIKSGTASPEIVDKRNASCNTCPMLKTEDGKRYCSACGCGNWRMAELDKKLTYAYLECPLRRAGFSNEKSP